MNQKERAEKEIRKRLRRVDEGIGSLNCLTLFSPSGNRKTVIFLKNKTHSPQA